MRSLANIFRHGPRHQAGGGGTVGTPPTAGGTPSTGSQETLRLPDPRLDAAQELRAVHGERPQPGEPTARAAGSTPGTAPATPNWAAEGMETPEQRARRRIRQRIDDAISEAQERGEFDNLRGKGKPIPAELLVNADDAWLAGKTLANSGFLPPWLQLQHEIENDLIEARRLVERTERFPPLSNRELPLTELRKRLQDIQAKARRYNLMAPTMSLQRPLPKTTDLEQRMARAIGLSAKE